MRVAIVGGGISGLVAASLLDREHEVTVYEAAERAGGHAQTVRLAAGEGAVALDVGFQIYEPRGYPNFERLVIGPSGTATQRAPISLCVSDDRDGFEWASAGLGLRVDPAHALRPGHRRMLRDAARFNGAAKRLIEDGHRDLSFAEFLALERLSRDFVERLIVPEVATVWSVGMAEVLATPARFVAAYLDNLRLLQLRGRARFRSIVGGSARYVDALARPLRGRIRLGEAVRSVQRLPAGVEITARGSKPEAYEAVVIAVHPDQALAMLADPSPAERDVLGRMQFRRSVAALHTDRRVLPRRRRAWSSWNFRIGDPDPGDATVTYWLNNIQGLKADEDYFLTLNQPHAVDPGKTIRVFEFEHPVFSPAAVAAQGRWSEISGWRRTHYAGAHWRWGSHEDAVVSAIRATRPLLSREVPLAPAGV